MSELTNPNTPISEQDLKDFYEKIKPYLGTNAAPSEDMSEIVSPLPSIPTRKIKYSTDEQVIGEWIDGKPLYQKTFHTGELPDKTSKSVAHNISNLGVVVSISGTCYHRDGFWRNFPKMQDNDTSLTCVVQVSSMYIGFFSRSGSSTSYTDSYVTLQYTKTTD